MIEERTPVIRKPMKCTGADELTRDHLIRLAESVEFYSGLAEHAKERLENAMSHFGWIAVRQGIEPCSSAHPFADRSWKIKTSVLKGVA